MGYNYRRYGVQLLCRSHIMKFVGTEHCRSINLSKGYFKDTVSKDEESLWSVGTKTEKFQVCNQVRELILKKIQLFMCQFVQSTHILLGLQSSEANV